MKAASITYGFSSAVLISQDENQISFYKLNDNLKNEMGLSYVFFTDGNIADSAFISIAVQSGTGEQKWTGFYLVDGNYVVRYLLKKTETIVYQFASDIPGFQSQSGKFVVDNIWPYKPHSADYKLGPNWYSHRAKPKFYVGTEMIRLLKNDKFNI